MKSVIVPRSISESDFAKEGMDFGPSIRASSMISALSVSLRSEGPCPPLASEP